MKYLGIDYGAKRVGIAVSDAAGTIAFPRTTFANNDQLLAQLREVIEKERVEILVVGDTRSHGGADNPVTSEAEAFVAMLEREIKLPVERVWEMWSSIEASRYAPEGKAHDDSAAAAVILQRYLDMRSDAVE